MKFGVFVTARAERDIQEAYRFIAEHGPANSDSWKAGLASTLGTLETLPSRCGLAPESAYVPETIHQTFYANFRILFVIEGDAVIVSHIRHSARLPMTKDELTRSE